MKTNGSDFKAVPSLENATILKIDIDKYFYNKMYFIIKMRTKYILNNHEYNK